MRPGQNRRMRGRNGNRRGPNPLSRPYESNGPDVKVRGTAQHIAEKYVQLARDAQSSGDHVMAENYLQHAEHYIRIVLAAQEALAEQTGQQFPPQRGFGDEDGEDGEDGDGYGAPQPGERQPRQDGRQEGRNDGRQGYDRQDGGDRGDRGERPRYENRGEGGGDQGFRRDRQDNRGEGRGEGRFEGRSDNRGDNRGDRDNRGERGDRFERRPRFERDRERDQERGERPFRDREGRAPQGAADPGEQPQPSVTVEPRFRPRQPQTDEETGGLPAFVTAPVRQVINLTPPETDHDGGDEDAGADEAPMAAAPRRRGRPRKERSESAEG